MEQSTYGLPGEPIRNDGVHTSPHLLLQAYHQPSDRQRTARMAKSNQVLLGCSISNDGLRTSPRLLLQTHHQHSDRQRTARTAESNPGLLGWSIRSDTWSSHVCTRTPSNVARAVPTWHQCKHLCASSRKQPTNIPPASTPPQWRNPLTLEWGTT